MSESEPQSEPFSQLVVVGSSAGGIEALSTLVSTLPPDFPAPIVLAQHLDPRRTSRLGEILTRHSTLPVRTVAQAELLQPGTVFVVPADRDIEITDHDIRLSNEGERHPKPSIDLLLTSAAGQFGEHLIAVILTGTGSDGAAGARSVHAAGGTVIIQDPKSASYPGLPLSLAPSTVDIVADLNAIGPLLHDLLLGVYSRPQPNADRALRLFLDQVRERSGIDFSSYKSPTILRRLQRRMAATGTNELEAYIRYVQRNPDEYQRLISSFLIKVTEFFRDPELFRHLQERVIPDLIDSARQHNNELRLWSAGCATGEEAYSLAILLSEALGDELPNFSIRIFATDADGDAISFARRGIYPASALSDLSPPLIDQYFNNLDGQFEIKKQLRAMTVFGQHDLSLRAPFPRIDLALCRNVLIYFTSELQRRALQLFAFSLREGAYLVLGKSETTSPLPEHFVLEQSRLKIYRRQGEPALMPSSRVRDAASMFSLRAYQSQVLANITDLPRSRDRDRTQRRDRGDSIVQRLPIGLVIVDRRYDILSINTAARQVLGIHGSAVGEDLIHLTQGVSTIPLRAAIDSAFHGDAHSESPLLEATLAGGEQRYLRIVCYTHPFDDLEGDGSDTAVVLVLDGTRHMAEVQNLEDRLQQQQQANAHITQQAERLAEINRRLLEANQELTLANAELRSANEELLVATEESQAATEEVETLNEELQATNEELETLNEELQATVEELNTTNDDLQSRSVELQELAITLEEQRRASEEERARLQAVLGSMAEAVLLVDPRGAPILTNEAYDRIFGSNTVLLDLGGQPLRDDQHPARRAALGETFRLRFSVDSDDGPRRTFEASGQPIHGPDDELGGVVVIREAADRQGADTRARAK